MVIRTRSVELSIEFGSSSSAAPVSFENRFNILPILRRKKSFQVIKLHSIKSLTKSYTRGISVEKLYWRSDQVSKHIVVNILTGSQSNLTE